MKNPAFWGFIVASVLWFGAGLRDLFAPGFLTLYGHPVSNNAVALDFAIGAMFLVLAFSSYKVKPSR
jgi:hypothetical protein